MTVDAIVYTDDIRSLMEEVESNYPHLLTDIYEGDTYRRLDIRQTPNVVNGYRVMTYCRMEQEEVELYEQVAGFEFLMKTEFVGRGTADNLYQALESDEDALRIYNEIYPRPVEEIEFDGQIYRQQAPFRFGMLAGA